MKPQTIIDDLCAALDGVIPKSTWGETSLFYNPGRALPNGVYFCTFKERDGENDRASALTREGIFRVSIGISPETYVQRFGPRPARPAKGGVVNTGHDFAALDVLTPHPVYAWMGWVQILSPSLYSHHKLVMMATMRELARRWSASGRTVNVCYPGQASTAMTRAVTAADLPGPMRLLYPLFSWMTREDGGKSAEKASRSTVHLASSPDLDGVTGCYVDTRCRDRSWPKAIADLPTCRAVWDVVAPLAGVEV